MDPENTPPSTSKQKADLKFLEDSLIRTPDPQACSTVNRQKELFDFPEMIRNDPVENTEEPKFLIDERNSIDSLHQKLNQMFEKIKRESINSNAQPALSEVNSSLGILKIDDIGDLNDTYSSKVLESLMPNKVDDCEASWRMKRDLARQSMTSKPSLGLENKSMQPGNDFDFSFNREAKGAFLNPFDGQRVSGLPSFSSEEFDTGASAKQKLLEGEAHWRQTNADIPVENTDRSLSGIFPGDDAAENMSSASSYLRSKSEPIGTLGGDRDNHQRPYFGMDVFSPTKSLDSSGCIADALPKECSINQSTGHDLSVSSIASITQIKEMLGEMGQNSPTLIINKLMNGEGRKKSKQARVDTLRRPENAFNMRKENLGTIDLTHEDKKAATDKFEKTKTADEIIDLTSPKDNFQSLKPFSSPQRSVLQDMTNLQRSPVKVIDLETNSTILDPSVSKTRETNAERSRANDREMSFLNLEISSDSFMVGPLSRSTSIEDIGKAINANSCNSSVVDDSDDNIKLRFCIGSICTVMITLSNSSPTNSVHCSISLIEVLKNKQLCPKAVKIIFPPEVTLIPGETKKVEIQVIPFAIGVLDIALQVDEVEDEIADDLRSFLCTVTLKSEKPRLIISKVPEDEFLNNSQIDFGLLPEESQRKSVISIENVGNVKVPLNITVSDDSSKFQVFHLQETDRSEVIEKLVILDPGERLEESVYCFTPPLDHDNITKTSQKITGELCVSLASIVRETTKFARYQLSTTVGYTRVLISPNCNPLVVSAYEKRPLLIRNASVLPLTLNLLVDDAEFRLESDVIRLDSNQDGTIMVEFSPIHFKSNTKRSGRLWLCIDSTETRYEVKIIGQCTVNHGQISSSTSSDSITRPKSVASVITSSSKSPHGSKTTTPYTSRSSSPCSSNLTSEKGSLDLACTHSALVWASCPLQIAERKVCVLRNKNNYKEKLLLAIVDNSGCYKLVEEKGSTVQEMRINLEGMESRQVTVSYCPLQVGASKASLVITRASQKSACGQPNRKVLYLYGYGGKSVLNIRGVNKDPESRMWMYLDPDEIRAQFTLENSGDGTAFVRISQDIADTGVTITPQEALIPAHKKIVVDLSFCPTTGRADHLLSKSEDSDVLVVTRLKIMFGDEATRLRLKRLYRIMINDRVGMDSLLMERLSVLDNLFPGSSSTEISCLKDTQASMKTLWVEGIRETSIGVMLEKSALENAHLDSTAQFIDLATTVTDDTVYMPKQQLIVAPRVVNLSWTQPKASFTLRNTTLLPSRVQIQGAAGLTVHPATFTLESHSSCTVTVTRNDAKGASQIASASLLKIYSDCTDVIEVPVNWNKIF